MESKNWVEKYRPKKFADIKGQDEAVAKIINFINNFSTQRKKAIFLHGPPGTGKTTLASVASTETNSEIFELNSSDFRNKKKLQETLKPALEQQSLLKKKKIILIDEADGIMGTDRGGVPEIVRLIKKANCPLILTANDVWSSKLSPLRKESQLIEIKKIDYRTIKNILITILRSEKKFIGNETLTEISLKSKGDLRAAINDLEAVSLLENPSQTEFSERNTKISIFDALKKVFQKKPSKDLLRTYDSVDMPIDEIILWIEKNIPKAYKGKELENAYNLLSKVDIFKGRIYKQQYWRFLVYENILLSYGIASVKKEDKNSFVNYKKPTRILKIWMNNQKNAKKKTICKKYAEHVHISTKTAMKEFQIIKKLIKSNSEISKELKLDEDELAYLNKS